MSSGSRLSYIDNLRGTLIFFVVAMHAAVTCSHMGSWYYMTPEAPGIGQMVFFGLFQSHLQAFFMGLLFLLAGYFTPASYDRKGFWRFLGDRFVRLMIPALIFIFLIHDTMGHYLLHWHHEGFVASYRYYLMHGDFLDGTGPMWFVVALFILSLGYGVCRLIIPQRFPSIPVPPSCMIVLSGLVIGAMTFAVRLRWSVGTSWHNMAFCYFTQYVVYFIIGICAARGDWLRLLPAATGGRLLKWSTVLGPLVWLALITFGGALQGDILPYNGGMTWQSLSLSLWEQVFAICFSSGLIVFFRERIYTHGRLSQLLSDNSFAVYMFHAPVLVGISLAVAPLPLPALPRFLLLSVVAFAATLALSHYVLRRIPLLKSVL